MGFEPTSIRSQHIILPFKLLSPFQKEGIEPSPLMSKTNIIPFRRLLEMTLMGLEPIKTKT
jgi:hypothetical protein